VLHAPKSLDLQAQYRGWLEQLEGYLCQRNQAGYVLRVEATLNGSKMEQIHKYSQLKKKIKTLIDYGAANLK
jgi:hypothetical protein